MDTDAGDVTVGGPARWNRRMVLNRMVLGLGAVAATVGATDVANALAGDTGPGNASQAWAYERSLPRLATTTPRVCDRGLTKDDHAALDRLMRGIAERTSVKPRWSTSPDAEIIVMQKSDQEMGGSKEGRYSGGVRCTNKTFPSDACTRVEFLINADVNVDPKGQTPWRVRSIQHEFLHALGVGHCSNPQSVMYRKQKATAQPRFISVHEYAELNRIYSS